jgi:NADPH:quinone reductase-like Zn-dependent oxidoreductase
MRLTGLLVARGDAVIGLIRNPDHAAEVRDRGADPVICDLEHATVEQRVTSSTSTAEPSRSSRGLTPPCCATVLSAGTAPLLARGDDMKAVRFDQYGGVDVLEVREVEDPVAAPGQALVAVKAAGINPGEISIRDGRLHERWPASFPSGEGTDLAGVVQSVGDGVTAFAAGDEVLGWTEERASHAELVVVPADQLTAKPASVSWEVAGSLFVVGMAAYASVQAVAPQVGETVVVSAAAGGVGSAAVQLARRTGATVIGLAGEHNHDWLRRHDIVPVRYGDGQADRIREAAGGKIDAFIDTFGGGYVDLAIELGGAPERINTIIDYEAVQRLGVQAQGTHAIASATLLARLAALVADGSLEIPIARTFPLDQVRDAFRALADRHTHGKIVLLP